MISVGIDISKDKSTVCMLRPYGEVVEAPYSIEHTEQALNALIERIKSFDEDVKVVLEATGGYHQVIVTKLLSAGIFTVVVNPYIMKKYCAAALRKAKTDKIDSIRIANYGIDHWVSMTAYCPPAAIIQIYYLAARTPVVHNPIFRAALPVQPQPNLVLLQNGRTIQRSSLVYAPNAFLNCSLR